MYIIVDCFILPSISLTVIEVTQKFLHPNLSYRGITYLTQQQNWNFRPKGEGRSGRRPLLPKKM